MSDEKLRQLLSVSPEEEEITARAARARHRVLARLREHEPARFRWVWAPALAAVALLITGGIWVNRARRIELLEVKAPVPKIPEAAVVAPAPVPVAPPKRLLSKPARGMKQDRLELHWVLSDGTRVEWTFDKNFNL